MNKTYLKFGIGFAIILGTVGWLAATGLQTDAAYYKTIEDLDQMGDSAYGKRLRVAGEVVDGSLHTKGTITYFKITQLSKELEVKYTGSAPVPDNMAEGAEAVVEGKLLPNGQFEAKKIQAKCASKYDSEDMTEMP
jgi:cytochrome c-type biogenesis protein CcmE